MFVLFSHWYSQQTSRVEYDCGSGCAIVECTILHMLSSTLLCSIFSTTVTNITCSHYSIKGYEALHYRTLILIIPMKTRLTYQMNFFYTCSNIEIDWWRKKVFHFIQYILRIFTNSFIHYLLVIIWRKCSSE